MKIENSKIHYELRGTARVIRFILPSFTLKIFHKAKEMCRFMVGHHNRNLQYEQVYLERADGSKLRLCVYSPLTTKQNVPGILWIHGGGYALGIPEQDETFIKRFIDNSGCVVVSPDYTLSIDAPYPAALEDCYLALIWLRDNGAKYGMRSDQIFVGGDSAGGGLTAAISLLTRDKGEVSIAFQMPLYPMLDDRATESNTDNDAPLWNSKSNDIAWSLYLGDLSGKEVPAYAAPARATNFNRLPPTCSFVGSIEPFHDETVSYIDNLHKNGIETHFKVFEGCFHAFDLICSKTNVSKQATEFLVNSFRFAVLNYYAKQPNFLK